MAKKAGIELTAVKARRGKPNKVSPECRAEIVSALEANPNASAVARQIGSVSVGTVWNIAKEAGIELAAGNLSPEQRAEIVSALEANPNVSAVTRQIGGVSARTVWNIAKEAGIELADNGGRNKQSPERHAEIIRALEAEPNAHAVARKIGGISPAGVWNIAKKAGIELIAGRAAASEHLKLHRADPEFEAKRIAGLRRRWDSTEPTTSG